MYIFSKLFPIISWLLKLVSGMAKSSLFLLCYVIAFLLYIAFVLEKDDSMKLPRLWCHISLLYVDTTPAFYILAFQKPTKALYSPSSVLGTTILSIPHFFSNIRNNPFKYFVHHLQPIFETNSFEPYW